MISKNKSDCLLSIISDDVHKGGLAAGEAMTNKFILKHLDLEFCNINYHVSLGKNEEDKAILKNTSGKFRAGQLIAIMGPSGAGKSSLMNILAGYRTKNVSGDIYVNNYLRNLRNFRKMSCYIMQDDHLLPHLTVEESMLCSAELKLSESLPYAKKKELISDILEVLGLTSARNTRAISLSGGQRKRLSIALELVNNPPIMFFDEPTSGLDSSSCYQCISLLQGLARDGRTIICTIHQPSAKIFEMFDQLYFLADGQCIYRGDVANVVPYLRSQNLICPAYHNPADFFMEVACGEHGDFVSNLSNSVSSGLCDEFNHKCRMANVSFNIPSTADNNVRSSMTKCASDINQENIIMNINSVPQFPVIKDSSSPLSIIPQQHSNGSTVSSVPVNTTPSFRIVQNSSTSRFVSNVVDDELHSTMLEEQSSTFATSLWTQFRVLYVRTVKSIMRDSTLTALRFLSHATVGILIGLLYYKIGNDASKSYNNAACLFFSFMFVMFAALMPTLLTFPMEISVFIREHLNYWYSLKAYYLAKTLADMPFQIGFPIMYSCIVYWMSGQPDELKRFLMFTALAILTSLVAQSLGLVVGAATSIEVSTFLGPVTSIPLLLFCGFFVSFDTIPKYLQWLSYVSYIRYSFEGVMKAIYGFDRGKLECPPDSAFCLSEPKQILEMFHTAEANFYVNVAVLFFYFILLRSLCYVVLKWKVRGHR